MGYLFPRQKTLPGDLLHYESVALFVKRVHRTWSKFQLNRENGIDIATICQLVGGSPLGIELAVAQLHWYTCAEIVQALQSGYDLLASSQRKLPLRQRRLQTVLAYSCSLLRPAEQQVVAACSVFQGDATRAVAATVAHATPVVLSHLENKSPFRRRNQRFTPPATP